MVSSKLFCFVFVGLAAVATLVSADTVQLSVVRDNTIYEENTDFSNGSGLFFFAGNNGDGDARRGLIVFDIEPIPKGATINDVTIRMFNTQTNAGFEDVSLHRLTGDWGEAGSMAPMGEGGGTAAEDGDATWIQSFHNQQSWGSAGGDFVTEASAVQSVGDVGFASWTAPSLVADVQSWVNGDNENFGWIAIGDESATPSAKRFAGKNDEFFAPQLFVDFTAVPEPSALALLFACSFLALVRAKHAVQTIQSV